MRFSANDGAAEHTDDVMVSAFEAGPAYEAWRAAQFGPDDAKDRDRSGLEADPDGDGLRNVEEFVAGTDPRSEASTLRLDVRRQSNGGLVWVARSAKNRTYRLERSANATTGPWTLVRDILFAPCDCESEIHAERTGPSGGASFYRLVLTVGP